MAAFERELLVKQVHYIPKLESSHLKSRQNLGNNSCYKHEISLIINFLILHFQSLRSDNPNILVYFSQFARIFVRSDVFIKKFEFCVYYISWTNIVSIACVDFAISPKKNKI